jgi:hypothetical protein
MVLLLVQTGSTLAKALGIGGLSHSYNIFAGLIIGSLCDI